MFLFSGKLIPRKDPLGLLDALRGLSGLDRAGLIVLGDGELRAAFEPLARELFGDRLIFPGFVNQSQLGKYLAAGDVFVLPSRYETWGLVVNEAMLFGMPAIVSDQVGCHPDLVRQGSTGFVYACGNGDELSRCLQRMLADPLKARKMGTAARTLASQYTIEASARGVFQALGLT